MTRRFAHRLDGLEPDNFLAFLALLGLMRALETARADWRPRAFWDTGARPWRPTLSIAAEAGETEIADAATTGVAALAVAHNFGGRKAVDYTIEEAVALLGGEDRSRRELIACLLSPAAYKPDGLPMPTPYCLMFGQGHQHFLERFAGVPRTPAPPARGRGKKAKPVSAGEAIAETIFRPWARIDAVSSFRWDPEEANRYALRARNPSGDPAAKTTQHGANRLAAVALPLLPTAAVGRRGEARPLAVGATYGPRNSISIRWPIWTVPARLSGIVAMLRAGPDAAAVRPPGIAATMRAERTSLGKFMIVTPAQPVPAMSEKQAVTQAGDGGQEAKIPTKTM